MMCSVGVRGLNEERDVRATAEKTEAARTRKTKEGPGNQRRSSHNRPYKLSG
jgi:hypothetical protein